MCNCEDVRLFCNGYYPEVIVMDPFSLEILFMLSSKVNPDWISALHVRTATPFLTLKSPNKCRYFRCFDLLNVKTTWSWL